MREKMLPYGCQQIDDDDVAAVVDILRSAWLTQGPAIERFERDIADYSGAKHAVAFANGTAALHGACYAAGIGQGDEVITSPLTFVASSNCVLYCGGKPVFADIRPDTYNLDPQAVLEQITDKTKAIIPVDFSGQPAEMDAFSAIARDHGLVVIEDAAHSLGAEYGGRRTGSLADMTMFSFHPVKHITTGEGGIIVTDSAEYADRLRAFRSHGITRDPGQLLRNDGPWYYEMQSLGYNYRITDLQAALGSSQLKKLDTFVARRREIAAAYTGALAGVPGLQVPYQHPDTNSSWHLYVLRWKKDILPGGRDRAFDILRSLNIGVHVHYIPVYQQPYYQSIGYETTVCSHAEAYYSEALSLPIFPGMTDRDVQDVIDAVLETVNLLAI
ncbi:UDP-4-amino-4,6-dideoxy-N-acetyl-beta-L-altrosamine transaminase [Cohnella faecalis]|nr:UDP-4-amino-4,6-dideoxy-N-acetyl-beta-L-altrosamine transaminase [Cohnella faecalis]